MSQAFFVYAMQSLEIKDRKKKTGKSYVNLTEFFILGPPIPLDIGNFRKRVSSWTVTYSIPFNKTLMSILVKRHRKKNISPELIIWN